MPRGSPNQPSFSGGEFGPKAWGRTNSERYKTALEVGLNYIATTSGPLLRRPGLKYVGANVKDPSKPPAFIEFKFSQTQNYILEFGDQYVRFFTREGQITTSTTHFRVSGNYGTVNVQFASSNFYGNRFSGLPNPNEIVYTSSIISASSILEIGSPYVYPDVFDLKVEQREDTLYIVHSSYPQYKLQRFSNQRWDLKVINHLDGPYLPLRSYRTLADAQRVTIVAGAPTIIYQDTSMDHLVATTGPVRQVGNVTVSSSGLRRITSTAHGFYTGDKVVIRDVTGAVDVNNGTSSLQAMFWTALKVSADVFDLAESSLIVTSYTGSGVIYPALWEPYLTNTCFNDTGRSIALIRTDGGRAWGRITRVLDMARFQFHIDATNSPLVSGSSGSLIVNYWQLGIWNRTNGYPNAVTLHQDRLSYAGTPQVPQEYDLSVTGEYENFAASGSSSIVSDDNALQFSAVSAQLNATRWLKSDEKGLLSGTVNAEWLITPSTDGQALTPSNINTKVTSEFGSHNAQAVKSGNGVLYIQNGQKRVRELNYFFQYAKYKSSDMSELAEHLSAVGLAKLAVQKESEPIVWALRADGQMIALCYSRDEAAVSAGWTRQQLGGASDSTGSAPIVRSMAVIPNSSGVYDQLWCAVQRYINGTSVVTIEAMQDMFADNSLQEDAGFLDCAGTYDQPTAISGLTSGGSALVTAAAHGFTNGDSVLINRVIGLNSSVVDVNGVIHTSSLVNYRRFTVASASTNAFFLQDFSSRFIDSRTYGAYFSGGEVRKLVSSISGITWLKNETVSVLGDGAYLGQAIVNSAGVLALSVPSAKVQYGYAYNSDGKTLRPDAGSADGSAIGKMRRVGRVAFMLHNVGDFYFGPSFDKLTPMADIERFFADNQAADQAPPLFSGISRDSMASVHDFDGQVCWRQNSPLPGMVQSVTPIVEENDV